MKLLTIAWRNVHRHKVRSLLSGFSIAVSAASIVFMFALINGMLIDMKENIFSYYSGQVRIRNAQFEENEEMELLQFYIPDVENLQNTLKKLPGYSDSVSRIQIPAKAWKTGNQAKDTFALGIGADIEKEKVFMKLGKSLVHGRFPSEATINEKTGKVVYETAISRGLSEKLKLKIGDRINIFFPSAARSTNNVTLRVTGILFFPMAELNDSSYFIPLKSAQTLMQMNGGAAEILIKLKPGISESEFIKQTNQILNQSKVSGLSLKSWDQIDTIFSAMAGLKFLYWIFALIFFVLSSTVIINTTIMVILERIHEIGILSALGLKSGQIRSLFFFESLFISMIGALSGILAGIGFSLYFGWVGLDYSKMMEGIELQMPTIIYPVLNLESTLYVFLFSTALSSLITLVPTRKVSKIPAVLAIRHF